MTASTAVDLVYLVCLVTIRLVSFNQKLDRPNEHANASGKLVDFFSILLSKAGSQEIWRMPWHGLAVRGIDAETDITTSAEGYEIPRAELPLVTVGRDR